MGKYQVDVISPFPLVCIGLEKILKKDFDVAGVIPDYKQAVEFVKQSESKIIVAGISPGYWRNTRIIRTIKNERPDLPILVYSACKEYAYPKLCMEEGADGYVLMTEPKEKVVEAVYAVLKGEKYVSDSVKIIPAALDELVLPMRTLSDTESVVFDLIGQGFGNEKIRNKLGIKLGTLKTHLKSIRGKFGITMDEVRECAVQYAIREARKQRQE